MQVFEFHFNPPKRAAGKSDLIFDSFCFEPENLYEKKLGSLYMVGLLKNVLPQNANFLDKLSKILKESLYKTVLTTPEKSLKGALKKSNEFLEKIARTGDVSWLGNLSFGVISLKNFELNFAKVGDLKIFLLRKNQIIDIDKNVKMEDIEPYPLKIFSNIVSGELNENDIVLVLTKEVADIFLEKNLLEQISKLLPFRQKKLKEILDEKREGLSKISGICLLLALTKETISKERELFKQSRALRFFSFKEVFKPLIRFSRLPKITIKKPSFTKPSLAILKIKFELPKPKFNIKVSIFEKKIISVLLLILFLALGFFIFGKLEEKQLETYKAEFKQIQETVSQAESYLLVAKNNPLTEKKAKLLLKESLDKISPLSNLAPTFPPDFSKDILTLKNTISENLTQLSKLTIIEKPEPVFEFKPAEFIPNKIIASPENLYFFSPYSENIFELNKESEGKILSLAKKINAAILLSDSILFFSKPNQLINFKEGVFQELNPLETPYADFNLKDLSTYQFNLYFLDNQKGTIIKYPYWGDFQWGPPQNWLSSSIKNAFDFRSMAVDGSVWILSKNNSIQKYYAGILQETLNLDIFPSPKNFTKILTFPTLPYLYILEPTQKRIVIVNKTGEIIKQFQSEKFDNLLDFTVSPDGKTIYPLNGLKVFKLIIINY